MLHLRYHLVLTGSKVTGGLRSQLPSEGGRPARVDQMLQCREPGAKLVVGATQLGDLIDSACDDLQPYLRLTISMIAFQSRSPTHQTKQNV